MRSRALILCWAAFLFAALGQAADSWSLVWHDEFNQEDGSAPDNAKWTFDVGGGGWGNNELQYYTDRRANARVERGCLVIEACRESFTGTNTTVWNFTSARLKTKDKWFWTYGRIEARIRLPRGQGLWPAFWTLGTNIDLVHWPTCGEIDIMENVGREPQSIHGTIHGPCYSGNKGVGQACSTPDGANVSEDFHLFAVEWETNRIRWFLDDQPYFSVSPESLPDGARWVFNEPQFLLLNLAVGGRWPGNPDDTTLFPQRMLVDFVRVYTRTNESGR